MAQPHPFINVLTQHYQGLDQRSHFQGLMIMGGCYDNQPGTAVIRGWAPGVTCPRDGALRDIVTLITCDPGFRCPEQKFAMWVYNIFRVLK